MNTWRKQVPDISAAYVLFCGAEAIYVGSSLKLRRRLTPSNHRHVRKADRVLWFACAPAQLEARERELFAEYRPTLNIRAVRRDDWWIKDPTSWNGIRHVRDKDYPNIPHPVSTGLVLFAEAL